MRTLAIDLGTRRVGLALSDEGGKWASPLSMLEVTDPVQAIDPVIKVIADQAVVRVVVGCPLNMDDTMGPAARAAFAWGRQLLQTGTGRGLTFALVFVDERLSSFMAEQQLNTRKRAGEKLTRQKKKARLDALAAAEFLQQYLDGNAIDVVE